jgi:hypothetical protein
MEMHAVRRRRRRPIDGRRICSGRRC